MANATASNWPTVALRKAAKKALVVTPQELRAAYETQYGPAVQARMIVCDSEKKKNESAGLKVVIKAISPFSAVSHNRYCGQLEYL